MNQIGTTTATDAADSSLNVDPWWKIWTNPLILRYIRSRLRLRRSIGWILTVFIISSFTFFIIYLTSVNRDIASHRDAARGVLFPLFMIQGFILMFMGTGSVASGLVRDKIDGTMDYERLTPMNPLAKIIGYLFGLPIREYLLVAITLPYTIYGLVVGQIPFFTFSKIYLIFSTSVILYHLTGMAAGMISRKWRFTARLTQGLVILLYVILPHFSHLGLYGFQYLTVQPVLTVELAPLIPPEFAGGGNSAFGTVDRVPFFIWGFSSFTFSLLLQLFLIFTLGLMSYRKWRDQNQHALSKGFGIAIFAVIAATSLGNIWPILTRVTDFKPPILGGMANASINEGLALSLPLIFSFVILLTGMWILTMITPSHHEVLRGWRKVVKADGKRLGWWSNESPAGLALLILVILGCGTIVIEIATLVNSELLTGGMSSFFNGLWLPAAVAVALLSFYASLISLENRRIFVVLLLGWILPCLFAVFVGAAFSSYRLAIYIASLSPAVMIAYGGTFIDASHMNVSEVAEFQQYTQQGFWIGLTVQTILVVFLLIRWSGLYAKLVNIARSGTKDVPAALLEQEIED